MSPSKRRAAAMWLAAFFIVMCAAIAYSQWYAEHVNVPRYESGRAH